VIVPTLTGKADMKIPPGTQSGKIFRLKEKGVPDVHTRDVGDELIRVVVDIPTKLTAEQRKLIEDFSRLSGEDGSKDKKFWR
jgi:molecular chaperone DnaJ